MSEETQYDYDDADDDGGGGGGGNSGGGGSYGGDGYLMSNILKLQSVS